MEHRDDLEKVLLDGLASDERRHVVETIAEVTAKKLAHLRSRGDAEEPAMESDDPEFENAWAGLQDP